MRSFAFICLMLSGMVATPATSIGAEFKAEKSSRYGAWETSLYRNLGNNKLFCAAETRSGETDFRINRYKASGESFLEIYNSKWSMMPGNVGFTIEFDIDGENYSAELRGRSWGDSYTHDFTDVKTYQALLGMIAQSKSLIIKNSNDAPIAEFDGSGAGKAIRSFVECVDE